MAPMIGTLERGVGLVSSACVVVGCLWTAVLIIWIVVDVLGRASGVAAIVGTPEIASQSVVGITFLCMPYAMRRGGHIRSTVVFDRLRPRVRGLIQTISLSLGAGIFLLVAWASWEPMVRSWARGEYEGEGALRVPVYPLRSLVVLVSVLMVLESLIALRRYFAPHPSEAIEREGKAGT